MSLRRQFPFYRSETVHLSLVVSGAFLAFAFSPWAPSQWRDTPSLRWMHHLIPWPVICTAFVIYTLLQLFGSLRAEIVANFLGLFFYAYELAALLATLHWTDRTNPFAIAAVLLACVLHFAAGRLAVIQMWRPAHASR